MFFLAQWHLGTAEANAGSLAISLDKPIYATNASGDVRDVALSADGSYLAFQTDQLTQIVNLTTKTATAKISHLPLPGSQMVAVFGQPCVVALLRGDIEKSTLSIVRCADGAEIASAPLLPKHGDGTDTPQVAQACGIVVAQTQMGIIVYDAKSARPREDLLSSIPKHFEYLFSARAPKSCDLFFGISRPTDATTVRVLRLDVRSGRSREVVRLGAREGAEAPLLMIGSNGAVSPSARTLAIPTFRADSAASARPWESGRTEVFDVASGRSLFDIKIPTDNASLSAVAFLGDSHILVGSQGGGTSLVSMSSRALQPLPLDNAFTLFDYAPQSMKLVAASNREIRVYRVHAD